MYNMYIAIYGCIGDIWRGLYSTTSSGAMGKRYISVYFIYTTSMLYHNYYPIAVYML